MMQAILTGICWLSAPRHRNRNEPIASDYLNRRRNRKEFRNEKKIWLFFIAKRIGTAIVTAKYRLLDFGQLVGTTCSYSM